MPIFNVDFLLTSLIVVLVPGTGVIYTVSTGLFSGRRASVAAALGCTAGIIPHMTASILGLSAVLHASAVAFQCVKYIGAAYLLFLAWSMWRESGAVELKPLSLKKGFRDIAVKGFLLNILNPKLSIFFLAFLPLFVSPDTPSPVFDMYILGGVFMAMTLAVFILYGISANGIRRYVINSPRAITLLKRSFAVMFAIFGVKLAMAEQ
jgi:threonine/homoserine/homoserine lactone efflux protein